MRLLHGLVGGLLLGNLAAAKVIDRDATIAGLSLHYKVVLPNDYDPAHAYPAVLAFPPGRQTMDMVQFTLMDNWALEAQRRGYIVVIPAAPGGELFFEGGSKAFPEFLDKLLAGYKIRDNKFYVAGLSNGGISAFHVAASYPRYFLSVIGFPGYLADPTPERVQALAGMCIFMHAGERDGGWVSSMRKQADEFRSMGYHVCFTIEPGEGHVIRALAGSGAVRLFQELEEPRPGCAAGPRE